MRECRGNGANYRRRQLNGLEIVGWIERRRDSGVFMWMFGSLTIVLVLVGELIDRIEAIVLRGVLCGFAGTSIPQYKMWSFVCNLFLRCGLPSFE